jgi:hypothetical protein
LPKSLIDATIYHFNNQTLKSNTKHGAIAAASIYLMVRKAHYPTTLYSIVQLFRADRYPITYNAIFKTLYANREYIPVRMEDYIPAVQATFESTIQGSFSSKEQFNIWMQSFLVEINRLIQITDAHPIYSIKSQKTFLGVLCYFADKFLNLNQGFGQKFSRNGVRELLKLNPNTFYSTYNRVKKQLARYF